MERLGRYQIERELGRGAMSIVYEAFDPHINRHLAVKVLRDRYVRDVKSRQRFLREARSAGGLNHPNIVTVFDVGQAEGQPYLVMERLQGESLEEYLDSVNKVLEPGQIIDMGIQLAGALNYAHERGVIHRDIKPSNIFIDQQSGLVKLVDFGIAAIDQRIRERGYEENSITGTPRYMAPEQIQGGHPDHRADLYSLGVVLYQLVTGKLPFGSDSLNELIQEVVNQPPPRPEPRHNKTPMELIELVMRLLAKPPEARYQNAAQVLEELQQIRANMERGLLKHARRTAAYWVWPLALSLCLTVALGSGLAWIHRAQITSMLETTYGYGDALTSVIARETAEALLLDDSTALANLVADFSANPRVVHLNVSNREGVIQASTDPFLQGEGLHQPDGAVIDRAHGSVRLIRLESGTLEFTAPVQFQSRRIGQVQLGIDGNHLQAAARSTLWMLIVVFLTTVLVGAIGLIMLVRWQLRSAQRLAWGFQRLAHGHYDFRLGSPKRHDMLAPLYRRFNDLAVRLQDRHGQKTSSAPSGSPRTTVVTLEQALDKTAELPVDHGKRRRNEPS